MMYSGHTYFTCLYALGLYEVIRKVTTKQKRYVKVTLITLVCILTAAEQAVEIWAVLSDRFHYSMDILMAIVITFLFYTNGAMCTAAKYWVFWMRSPSDLGPEFWHKSPLNLAQTHADQAAPALYSGGDVLVPICCFPCCCLAGREHLYNDYQIEGIIRTAAKLRSDAPVDEDHAVTLLKSHLVGSIINMDEGIHRDDPLCHWNFFLKAPKAAKPPKAPKAAKPPRQDRMDKPLLGDG